MHLTGNGVRPGESHRRSYARVVKLDGHRYHFDPDSGSFRIVRTRLRVRWDRVSVAAGVVLWTVAAAFVPASAIGAWFLMLGILTVAAVVVALRGDA